MYFFASAFTVVGSGFCRSSNCTGGRDLCKVNSIEKTPTSEVECRNMCVSDPTCVGYAKASASSATFPGKLKKVGLSMFLTACEVIGLPKGF